MMNGNDWRMHAGVDFSHEFLAHYGKGHLDGGNSGRYKWGEWEESKAERKLWEESIRIWQLEDAG